MNEMSQLKDYCDYLVEVQDEFDVTRLADETMPLPGLIRPHRSPRRRGWLVALSSAFVTLVVFGGFVLLAQRPTPATNSLLGDLSEGWVEAANSAALGLGDEGRLFRVIAGGPGFVATGVACDTEPCVSAIWVSSDGVAWSRVEDDPFRDHQIFDITARGQGVVAVGSTCQFGSPFSGENVEGEGVSCAPAVWVSPDGVTWTKVENDETFGVCTLCDAQFNQVVDAGFGLVATGRGLHDGSAIWISSDGSSWASVDDLEAFDGTWGIDYLVTDGPRVIGVGFICDASFACTAATWISENGTDWTRQATQGLGNASLMGFDVVGSSGVGVGAGLPDVMPLAWTSTDWITWTEAQVEEGSAGIMLQVVVPGGELVAFGYEVTGPEANVSPEQILFEMEKQQAIWLSADSRTWERIADIPGLVGGGIIADIVHDDGQLIALVTNPNASFIDANGATIWIRPSKP